MTKICCFGVARTCGNANFKVTLWSKNNGQRLKVINYELDLGLGFAPHSVDTSRANSSVSTSSK